jgi:hypothetical protein
MDSIKRQAGSSEFYFINEVLLPKFLLEVFQEIIN